MTTSDDPHDAELVAARKRASLGAALDTLLERALAQKLPLEAFANEALHILLSGTGATNALLETYDESLEWHLYAEPANEGATAGWVASVRSLSEARDSSCRTGPTGSWLSHPLDAAGEYFGFVAMRFDAQLDAREIANAMASLEEFAERLDNHLAFIATFRRRSIIGRSLGDALTDPVLERGLDAALAILRSTVAFDDLLLVLREDELTHGPRLLYRVIQGGTLTHRAAVESDETIDEFICKHAIDMIQGDSRALLARLGITRFREESIILGVRDQRVLGKLVVTSHRGELSIFDRDIIERFCDTLRKRIVDFAREYRQLATTFSRPVVERLLNEEDYEGRFLAPVERPAAILFADISGFTRISEQVLREPGIIAKLVDTWSYRCVKEIFELGGVFDKMVGDCVIALFGPPFFELSAKDACARALEAASRIRDITRAMNDAADIPELAGLNPPLGVATGLHYGPLYIGRVGPGLNFTGFGSAMNNAARLQSVATRDEILCMASFVAAREDPALFGEERSAHVKNVADPLRFRPYLR
ncbi:MAG: adenylate/guanylate cyclase domain-containing protein [Polyangiaceae bacterium]